MAQWINNMMAVSDVAGSMQAYDDLMTDYAISFMETILRDTE